MHISIRPEAAPCFKYDVGYSYDEIIDDNQKYLNRCIILLKYLYHSQALFINLRVSTLVLYWAYHSAKAHIRQKIWQQAYDHNYQFIRAQTKKIMGSLGSGTSVDRYEAVVNLIVIHHAI